MGPGQKCPDTVVAAPPAAKLAENVSPPVGWAVPEPPIWAANSRPVPAGSAWPEARVNVYVIVEAVLAFVIRDTPPTVSSETRGSARCSRLTCEFDGPPLPGC